MKKEIYKYGIYLQPQVHLDSGKIIGAEALVRRLGDGGQFILPDKFIPEMEFKEEIEKVDLLVMKKVCSLLKRWNSTGISELPFSVNLSRSTLSNPQMVNQLIELYNQSNLSLGSVILEITERSTDEKDVKINLTEYAERLCSAGFELSLDDYGSGFSNLKILSEIEFSELKIDKSLIDNLTKNHKARVLVESTVEMCKTIGNIRCIAQGVETESQVRCLRELGCEYGQGFYYYKPMSVGSFEKMFT
ncbi:MAG: EAL domain-containing protein [Lachnospiraceae bacterium]